MSTQTPQQEQQLSIPSTSTIVDTMVATTLCKSIGGGITGKLTPKNIGYLVLLSSIPDIKKIILDLIYAVKGYIINNFKSILSKITHTQLYRLISWVWKHTIGYLLQIRFKRSPEPTNTIIEEYIPIQPRFETNFQVDFKDNIQIIDNMITLFRKSECISDIHSMDLINKNLYCYHEKLSDLRYQDDELLIELKNPLDLIYENKDGQTALKKFNGVEQSLINPEEQKLADELGLILTEKPEIAKKFTDMMDNRLVAAFMDSEDYQNFSKAANAIGMKYREKIIFHSIYQYKLNSNSTSIIGFILIPVFNYLNITSEEEKYLLLHDILFYVYLISKSFYLNIGVSKNDKTNESYFYIKNRNSIIILNSKIKIRYETCHNDSFGNIYTIGEQTFVSNIVKYSIGKPNKEWEKINEKRLSIMQFLRKESTKDTTDVKQFNTKLTFNLSSLNPDLDLVDTFKKRFLKPLSKTIKSDSTKITVYSVKIDVIKKVSTKSNPDYSKYLKKKEEIEKLIEKTEKSDHGDLLGTFASLDIPDEEIEVVETEDKVVCTKENTLSKPFDTLYLREDDQENLTSILHNFKNSKEIYEQLGLRRKIGIMLYGDPGTGKSTTIIATATYLNYDIYYVSVSNIETNRQFKMIIDHINEKANRGGIIVMEDIDAQSEVFHKRSSEEENTIINLTERGDDKLDLSYILNMFDGTLSRDNNVFMFTTNHLDKIDPAVYRTGRVDALINLKRCDHYQIELIYKRIMKKDLSTTILERISVDRWTPADIIFHIVKYFYRPDVTDEEIMSPFIE